MAEHSGKLFWMFGGPGNYGGRTGVNLPLHGMGPAWDQPITTTLFVDVPHDHLLSNLTQFCNSFACSQLDTYIK